MLVDDDARLKGFVVATRPTVEMIFIFLPFSGRDFCLELRPSKSDNADREGKASRW